MLSVIGPDFHDSLFSKICNLHNSGMCVGLCMPVPRLQYYCVIFHCVPIHVRVNFYGCEMFPSSYYYLYCLVHHPLSTVFCTASCVVSFVVPYVLSFFYCIECNLISLCFYVTINAYTGYTLCGG